MATIGTKIKVEGEREFRQAMKNARTDAKHLKSEMDLLTSAYATNSVSLKQNAKNQENLKKAMSDLDRELGDAKSELDRARKSLEENGDETGELGQKVKRLETEYNGLLLKQQQLNKAMKDLPNSMELVGKKFQDAGDKIKKTGENMERAGMAMMKLTAPLVAAGAAAVKFGAEFDAGMSNVQAVMGVGEEGFNQLRDTAIAWGESTKYSAKEVSDALYYMGLAGWSAEESMSGIGGVLNLAAAGNLDLARTSDIVTDSMTALGISAEQYTNGITNAEHFSNVMAATMANSNTTVDMLGEAFKYVAPVAGTLGYSIEDLNLALGLMANSGIKSTQAGTTLRNILNRMAKPTKESAEAMDALNVSLDDGNGNMLSFYDVLTQLRTSLQNVDGMTQFSEALEEYNRELETGAMTEEEYNQAVEELIGTTKDAAVAEQMRYAAQLAGTRGLSGLLAIANASEEEFQALTETLYNADDAFDGMGYAAGMAETQMDNLKGDFTKLTSALGTSQIKIGDLVSGPLRKLTQSVTDLVVKFNNLDKEQQAQILKWAGMAAAIGPVLIVSGKLVQGIGGLVSGFGAAMTSVGAFSKAIKGGEGILKAFGAAGLNPVVLGIGAFAAALGLALAAMHKHTAALKEQYGLTEQEKELADAIQQRAEKYQLLDAAMKQEGENIETEFGQIEKLKEEYNALVDSTGQVAEANQEQADIILNQLAGALGLEVEQVRELVGENGKLGASIDEVIAKKKQEAILEAYHDEYIQALKDQKYAQEDLAAALANKVAKDQEVQGLQNELVAAQERYNQALAEGEENVGQYLDNISQTEQALAEAVTTQNDLNTAYEEAKNTLDSYTSSISNYEAFEEAVVSGSENIGHAQDMLVNNVKSAETASREALQQQYKDAQKNLQDIKKAYEANTPGITKASVDAAQKMVNLTKAELAKLPPTTGAEARKASMEYAKGVSAGSSSAKANAQALRDGTIAALKGGDTDSIGFNLGAGLGSGLARSKAGVISQASSLITSAIATMKAKAVIQSPSHVTRDEIGAMMVKGIIMGFKDEEKALDKQAEELIGGAMDSMTAMANGYTVPLDTGMRNLQSAADNSVLGMSGYQSGNAVSKNIQAPISVNVNVNGNVDDINALANQVADAINDKIIRRNEVFA